ncbi:hypothetical protein CBM2589_A70262 [Cupriavidus taiwanensis]|uniref:Uncharacterized protein n=1 Tax=Cupriavidus taiwanensis TaxID=164546 RepID=A0A375C7E3_9BURK|nr:hypothetical protein CBM2589_A70262 [Cupriavidus taiwanensis]
MLGFAFNSSYGQIEFNFSSHLTEAPDRS